MHLVKTAVSTSGGKDFLFDKLRPASSWDFILSPRVVERAAHILDLIEEKWPAY